MFRIILICNFKNEKYKSDRIVMLPDYSMLDELNEASHLTQLNLNYYGKYKV